MSSAEHPRPLPNGKVRFTDQQRDALLVELKSAVIDMGTVVLGMSDGTRPPLANYVKGLRMSIEALAENL